jgi:hypothetical protein
MQAGIEKRVKQKNSFSCFLIKALKAIKWLYRVFINQII